LLPTAQVPATARRFVHAAPNTSNRQIEANQIAGLLAMELFVFGIVISPTGMHRQFSGIYLLARDTVFLAGPFIEIDQLATLGTERPPGIILPFDGPAACWTFRHMEKVRRMQSKVKATGRN
jgi:hypothetical protein